MNDRPDGFVMIGLHKLAAQNGEGMVPELYELWSHRNEVLAACANVIVFPIDATRPPGMPPVRAAGPEGRAARNVIAFAAPERHSGRDARRK